MKLPESLLWGMSETKEGSKTLSGIKIYCKESIRKDLKDEFLDILKQEYFYELSVTQFGYFENLTEEITVTDYGLFISPGALSIYVNEDVCVCACGCCYDNALDRLYSAHPDIKILAYFGYAWKDHANQGVVQYDIMIPENESITDEHPYDFISNKLERALNDTSFLRSIEAHKSSLEENPLQIAKECIRTYR